MPREAKGKLQTYRKDVEKAAKLSWLPAVALHDISVLTLFLSYEHVHVTFLEPKEEHYFPF